uniref:Uncharacterized protein n=1 Tax=Odontella aurita TaxID=265563 RepID=A0A7S4JQA5_9STRA|mmetsp:Transcript_51011/g.153338  ORF Transcript_51011/g.153338 Transcript_51011/m.153338 type:complete len:172 (+) Transcript_51011:141-656(+)
MALATKSGKSSSPKMQEQTAFKMVSSTRSPSHHVFEQLRVALRTGADESITKCSSVAQTVEMGFGGVQHSDEETAAAGKKDSRGAFDRKAIRHFPGGSPVVLVGPFERARSSTESDFLTAMRLHGFKKGLDPSVIALTAVVFGEPMEMVLDAKKILPPHAHGTSSSSRQRQ